eukprot:4383649-Amphidinium_carterae.1
MSLAKQLLVHPSVQRVSHWVCVEPRGLHAPVVVYTNCAELVTEMRDYSCMCKAWREGGISFSPPLEWMESLARAMKRELQDGPMPQRGLAEELAFIKGSLCKATSRLQEAETMHQVTNEIFKWSASMQPGAEQMHLRYLLRVADIRGSEVILKTGEVIHCSSQEVPYPAYRWLWNVEPGFRFTQAQHINLLE